MKHVLYTALGFWGILATLTMLTALGWVFSHIMYPAHFAPNLENYLLWGFWWVFMIGAGVYFSYVVGWFTRMVIENDI